MGLNQCNELDELLIIDYFVDYLDVLLIWNYTNKYRKKKEYRTNNKKHIKRNRTKGSR